VALDLAVGDHTTSDGADSRGLEQCTDLCPTGIALFVDWLEHALECLLNFFDSTVDNGVVANIDAFSVGFFRCLTFSANVEGNDDSVRGCSQGDVGLGNRTNAAVDDVELYLVVDFNIEQGVFQCFHRTCVVTLEDEVEGRSLLEYLIQILEGNALAGLRLHSRTLTSITLRSNLACNTVIFHNQQVIAGTWNTIQALNLDRTGWTSFFNVMTELIKHATNATEGVTHNNGVTHAQSTALNDNGCNWAATTVKVSFNGYTLCIHVWVSSKLQRCIGSQNNCFQQSVDVGASLRGDIHEHGVATVLFWDQAVFRQLATDLIRSSFWLIDLVHSDHDWDIRCLCVVDGLYCLRHNAVVSCNHQDCQVSGLRTTGTHGGKRLVTRGIQEGNDALATIDINLGLVRTNALGNAAGLASAFIRPTDGIQQTSFTVVNVTHDGY